MSNHVSENFQSKNAVKHLSVSSFVKLKSSTGFGSNNIKQTSQNWYFKTYCLLQLKIPGINFHLMFFFYFILNFFKSIELLIVGGWKVVIEK